MGVSEPGPDRLIHAAYRLLGLITYFTSGVQEVRAWTIRKGTKAPGAAGVIHSDFERGFIKADTYHCADLFALGSEQAVKEKGLSAIGRQGIRREGRRYSLLQIQQLRHRERQPRHARLSRRYLMLLSSPFL